jgi:ribosomal protein L32
MKLNVVENVSRLVAKRNKSKERKGKERKGKERKIEHKLDVLRRKGGCSILGRVYKYCTEIFVNKQVRSLGMAVSPLGIRQPLLWTKVTFYI